MEEEPTNGNEDDQRIRSASVGDHPRPKKLFTSRAQSAVEASLDVRCACQFFETNLLLPDHINPYGSANDLFTNSRPGSRNQNAPSDLGSRPASPTFSEGQMQAAPADEQQRVECELHPSQYPTLEQELMSTASVPMVQKDAKKSILLQRRTSSASRPMAGELSTPTVVGQDNACPAVTNQQRSASSSSILRKRLSQQQQQSLLVPGGSIERTLSQQQLDLDQAFVPMRGRAPATGSSLQLALLGGPVRGPYPGEAYPIDYTLQQKLESIEATEGHEPFPFADADDGRLENTLVRGRSLRYAVEEDTGRGRSRKEKYQKQSEKRAERKARKQEQLEADERRDREREGGGRDNDGGGGAAGMIVRSLVGMHQNEDEVVQKNGTQQSEPSSDQKTSQKPSEVVQLTREGPIVQTSQSKLVKEVPTSATTTQVNVSEPEPEPEPEAEKKPTKPSSDIVENKQISITANTLVASLFHSSFSPVTPEPEATNIIDDAHYSSEKLTQDDPYFTRSARSTSHVSLNKPDETETTVILQPTPMRQRDPSQSSVLRKRYSTEQATSGSQQQLMRQRDPSQSSLLRKRYSNKMGPVSARSQSQSSGQRQPLDIHDDRSQRSVSVLMRQRDPSQSSILRNRMADDTASMASRALAGSQQSLQSTGMMRQKDLSTSKLLQKRSVTQSVERQTSDMRPEKIIRKNEEERLEKLEMSDRFEEKRDHEYEPINEPDHRQTTGEASANASVYEPIQDPNEPTAETEENIPATSEETTAGPRRKSFIDSANDRTRQIRASISSQAGALRTKFQSLKRPARSASREAPEDAAAAEDVEMAVDIDAEEQAEVEHEEAADEPKKSRATLAKLKSVQMPKLRKPQFKRPEFTKKLKAPEFLKERPAFTRAETYNFRFRKQASAADGDEAIADEVVTQRSASEEPPKRKARTKTKRFDFGTFPRIVQRLRKQSQPEVPTDFSTTASVSRGNDSQDTQETGDGGRRKLGPITFGTFPRMGRRSILTTSTDRSDSVPESVQTDQFEPMIRDESVERRLTERLHQAMAGSHGELSAADSLAGSAIDGGADHVQTEEQKQLAEYDEENRVIHQISMAREGEFRQRRPLKHQESDLTSEAESTGIERLKTRLETEWDRTPRGAREPEEEEPAPSPVEMDTDRLSTQETQSSGSSGYMRRKGVIDDTDRHTDFSHSDHDLRFESGSAGLGGSKASTDRMDAYYGERRPVDESFDSAEKYKSDGTPDRHRHLDHEDDISDSLRHSRHFDDYPDEDVAVADLQAKVDEYEDEFERLFYKHQQHLEDYRLQHEPDDEDMNNIIMASMERTGTPPVAPRRRKRKSLERSKADDELDTEKEIVYRTEHEYPEDATVPQHDDGLPPPVPIARSRTRSRSQNSWVGYEEHHEQHDQHEHHDHHSVSDVDSLTFDSASGKYVIDLKETNGYAVVRKEPPPRPPAPLRKRGSARSLSGGKFSTMPPMRSRAADETGGEHSPEAASTSGLPDRPTRNYHTIGPARPPRRTSSVSLGENNKVPSSYPDLGGQYEEIDQFQRDDLHEQHGLATPIATLRSMQHRPLPPPPRPPRERRSLTRKSTDPESDAEAVATAHSSRTPLEDVSRISSQDMEDVEEVEVACQTDPTAEDVEYRMDSFDQDTDAVLAPSAHLMRPIKTLEEVLKEEQQAELDRARQIADAQVLSRGIQKYRDANQRSYSERSQDSGNRPHTPSAAGLLLSGSRPHTPSALVTEKRSVISTTETDAALIVRPLAASEEDDHRRWVNLARDTAAEDTADTEDERIVKEALRRYHLLSEDSSVDKESEPTKKTSDIETDVEEKRYMEPVTEEAVKETIREEPTQEMSQPSQPLAQQQHGITDEEKLLSIEPAATISPTDLNLILTEGYVELAREDDESTPHVTTPTELPQAPPRRRPSESTSPTTPTAPIAADATSTAIAITEVGSIAQPATLQQQQLLHLQQDGRLHLTELEVDHLSVGALQANHIIVSDMQAVALSSQDLECKSGNLVVRGIELPAGFIEDLVDRVRSTERQAIEAAAAEIVQLSRQREAGEAAQAAAAAATAATAAALAAAALQPPAAAAPAAAAELPPPRPQPPSPTLYPTVTASPGHLAAGPPPPPTYYDSLSEPDAAHDAAPPPHMRSYSPASPRRRRQLHQPHHPATPHHGTPLHFRRRAGDDELADDLCWSSGDEELLLQQALPAATAAWHREPPRRRSGSAASRSLSLQRRAASAASAAAAAAAVSPSSAAVAPTATTATAPVAPSASATAAAAQPSILSLSGQLIRACSAEVGRSAGQVLASVRAITTKTDANDAQRQDANVGLIILIVIVALLMMLGMGGGPGRAIHTHHWDFYNPPENDGRQ